MYMNKKILLMGALIGLIVFLILFDIRVLNPTSVFWLQNNQGDLTQHYVGWLFFRDAAWSFPVGMISNLAYPFGLPVGYMDSIPLFAIPFKILSPVLPTTFQYFGLWGLLSYILFGALSAFILYRLTKSSIVAVIGAVILTLNPIMFMRMFGHTALAGQWIILLSIAATITSNNVRIRRFILVWSVVLSLAVTIHPYFVPMVGVMFLISLVLSFKTLKQTVVKALLPLAVMTIVFWLIGGFGVGGGYSGDGLDKYTLNINSLINSMGTSKILPTLPIHEGGYEGYAYLGVGVMLLIIMTVILSVLQWQKIRLLEKIKSPKYIISLFLLLVLAVLSIGTVIHIGLYEIALPVPKLIEKIWSIFRASGRLFWPVYYLIIIGAIVAFYKLTHRNGVSKKIIIGILIFVLLGQAVEIYTSNSVIAKQTKLSSSISKTYNNPLNIEEWNKVFHKKSHIFYLEKPLTEDFLNMSYLAINNNMTVNDGYFARAPGALIDELQKTTTEEIFKGKIDSKAIYLVDKRSALANRVPELVNYNYIKVVEIDNYIYMLALEE